jgi:hypothetical protein
MQEVEQSMLKLEQSTPKLEKPMSELKESIQEVKQSMQEVEEYLSPKQGEEEQKVNILNNNSLLNNIKFIALTASIFNLAISLLIFILFDFSTNQFQFVQEYHEVGYFDFYLGVDGLSIYFILLTTLIIPVSLLSN